MQTVHAINLESAMRAVAVICAPIARRQSARSTIWARGALLITVVPLWPNVRPSLKCFPWPDRGQRKVDNAPFPMPRLAPGMQIPARAGRFQRPSAQDQFSVNVHRRRTDRAPPGNDTLARALRGPQRSQHKVRRPDLAHDCHIRRVVLIFFRWHGHRQNLTVPCIDVTSAPGTAAIRSSCEYRTGERRVGQRSAALRTEGRGHQPFRQAFLAPAIGILSGQSPPPLTTIESHSFSLPLAFGRSWAVSVCVLSFCASSLGFCRCAHALVLASAQLAFSAAFYLSSRNSFGFWRLFEGRYP